MNTETSWNIKFEVPIVLSTVLNNTVTNSRVVDNIDNLCQLICTETWSGGVFKDNKRLISNFLSTHILALDIDGGISINQVEARLSGFRYIIAPTRNHNMDKNNVICERFRVILFLEQPITDVDTYKNTWNYALQIIPEMDSSCKDVSRQYYKSLYIHEVVDGALFPVIRATPPKPTIRLVPKGKYPVPTSVENFMKNGVDENWNHHLFIAAKKLQESGFEYDETVQLLNTMTCAQFNGALDRKDLSTIKSAYNKPGKYDAQIPWPVTIQSKNGGLFADPSNQNNFIYLIESILKLDLKYNELRHCIELGDRMWSDNDVSALRMKCRDFHLNSNDTIISDVVTHIALKNSYHPIKKLIEDNPWDGEDRISELYKTITIDGEDLPIYKEYLRRWLIGMVRKVYVPKTQTNVLTFLGSQSIGKSRWLEKFSLIPGIFNESQINPDSKDDKIRCTTVLVWSISEIDGVTRKKDASALKSFLTDSTFDIRSPYDKYAKQLTAICSFCASVNERNFLVDPTGNRRFNIIPVLKLDQTHKINMQQVLAQAYAIHLTDERHWFDLEEVQTVNKLNEEYMPTSRTDYLVTTVVPGTDELNAEELFNLLGYKESRTQFDYSALGRSLKLIGVDSKRVLVKGRKYTVYLINKAETINNITKRV